MYELIELTCKDDLAAIESAYKTNPDIINLTYEHHPLATFASGRLALQFATAIILILQPKKLLLMGAATTFGLLTSSNFMPLKINDYSSSVREGCTGWSLLHYAVKHNASKVATFLVSNGANIHKKDINGVSPIDVAQTNEDTSLLILLEEVSKTRDLKIKLSELETQLASKANEISTISTKLEQTESALEEVLKPIIAPPKPAKTTTPNKPTLFQPSPQPATQSAPTFNMMPIITNGKLEHSLLDAIAIILSHTAISLRQLFLGEIQQNHTKYAAAILKNPTVTIGTGKSGQVLSFTTLDEYLRYMCKPNAWLTFIEIEALSNALQQPIFIFLPNQASPHRMHGKEHPGNPILLRQNPANTYTVLAQTFAHGITPIILNRTLGNCLFDSIEISLNNPEYTSAKLRALTAQYMENNAAFYAEKISYPFTMLQRSGDPYFPTITNWATYLNAIKTNFVWVDHLEIDALAKALNIRIAILQTNQTCINENQILGTNTAVKPLLIGRVNGNHYVPLSLPNNMSQDDLLAKLAYNNTAPTAPRKNR